MMISMLPNHMLDEGFTLWLEEFKGGFRPDPKPDTLSTSIRSSSTVYRYLRSVADTGTVDASDPSQAVTDLRRPMGLLDGSGSTPILTDFGRQVLGEWESVGAVASTPAGEVARWAALIRLGLASPDLEIRERYLPAYVAWTRLATLPDPSYWLQPDLVRLLLPYYLARSDSRGYSPMAVVIALSDGRVGETADWDEWANRSWSGAGALTGLLDRITAHHRLGGTLNFRRALEVVRAGTTQDPALPALLEEWEIAS